MSNYIGYQPSREIVQYSGSRWDYVNTGNPAVDTDPQALGATWLNLTTGEEFVCTDNTEGKNTWVGSLESLIYYFPTSGLVHRWSGNQVSGSTVVAETGGVDGTILTGVTQETGGVGKALLFDGTGSVDIGSSAKLPATADWAVSAFININSFPAYEQCIFAQYLAAGGNGRIIIRVNNATQKMSMFVGDKSPYASTSLDSTSSVVIGQTHFVCVGRVGATFYTSIDDDTPTSFTDADANRSLLQAGNMLGSMTTSTTVYNDPTQQVWFDGSISDVAVWDHWLDADERAELYGLIS